MKHDKRPFKRSLKDRIDDNWIFAMPVIGAIGGAAVGVSYGAAASAVAATGLAVGGAVAGAIGLTALGIGGYVAAKSVWKNRAYITLGAMFSVALVGKMLSYPFKKIVELAVNVRRSEKNKDRKAQAKAKAAAPLSKVPRKLTPDKPTKDFNSVRKKSAAHNGRNTGVSPKPHK